MSFTRVYFDNAGTGITYIGQIFISKIIWTYMKFTFITWNSHSFFNKEHCSLKNEFNSSSVSLKSVMNLLLGKKGGMSGIFWLIKNVFNKDQYTFVLF